MRSKVITQGIFIAYCLLMVSFFLPLKYNSIALIFLGLISLFKIKYIIKTHKKQPLIILFYLFFLYLLSGMLYTKNLSEGWAIIERHYSLIFIPFVAPSYNLLSKSQRKKIINIFIITLILVSTYCLGYALINYIQTGSVYIEGFSGHPIYNKFMHHRLLDPIGMHAIFFSLYLSFSTIIILNRFIKRFKLLPFWTKLGYFLILIYFLILLILLKSALFAFALPMAILMLFISYFSKQILKSKQIKILLISLVFCIGSLSYYAVNSKINDFSTKFKFDDPRINSLKIRLAIWICSWETVKKNWLWGHGTGDANNALFETYQNKNFVIGIDNKFNAHNMYLQYWMSNGVVAVIFFLLLMSFFAIAFIKKKQNVAYLLLFLFAMFSFTESTMLKQNGIVFFILFATIFFYNNNISIKQEPQIISLKS